MSKVKTDLKRITASALFAAFICVASVFVVPIGALPLTLSNFAVMLCAFTLSTSGVLASVSVYLLLGLCSVPVFSFFQGGPQILFGITGGFLWGYIPLALFLSLAKRFKNKKLKFFLFVTVGMLCMYTLGVVQYCIVSKANFLSAILVCVLPFVAFDIIKCVAAYFLSLRLQKIVNRK